MRYTLNEHALQDFARGISLWAKPGTVIVLRGEVGAGKTLFARSIIRALSDNEGLEVPSPTFSLIQTYTETRIQVAHVDLYRLKQVSEAEELGLIEILASHLLIVEWADRYPALTEQMDCLTIAISGSGDLRTYELSPRGYWIGTLKRNEALQKFLSESAEQPFQRRFFQGDASTRRYELVTSASGTKVLMDMPARTDHNPVKNGKSYSALVHLADDIGPVLAINQQLVGMGYAAPRTYAADAGAGFALQEYLQGELHGDMMRRGIDMTEPFRSSSLS